MPSGRRAPDFAASVAKIQKLWDRYWVATQQPFYCLLFLFPLVAVYEFGMFMQSASGAGHERLVAQGIVYSLVSLLGAQGSWLPAAALVLTLLIWHMLSRNPWHIDGWVLGVMIVESALLALPLLMITSLPLQAAHGPAAGLEQIAGAAHAGSITPRQTLLAVGAGLYEELVFRLYLLTGLTLLFIDVIRLPRIAGAAIAMTVASIFFAACHVQPIGIEPLEWGKFIARMAAGLYLSLVFLGRGLGIAVGCHATVNILILLAGR